MGHSRIFAGGVTLLLLAGLSVGQSSADRHVWLPIKTYRGYLLVVEGSIGDAQHRKLLIDTAAYPSVIDEELAAKLHLSSRSDELRVVGQTLKSAASEVPVLKVGPIEVRNVSVQVQDLRAIGKKLGTHVDAIIGLDVLAGSSFRIDYEQKQMVFGPVGVLQESTPLKQMGRMTYVDTAINGQRARLLVGSAASNTTVFGNVASRMHATAVKQLQSTNLGGPVDLQQVHVERFGLGAMDLGPLEIQVTDSENLRTLPVDGLLSTGAMGFGQVAFDFEHQMLSWAMADKPRKVTALHDSRAANTGLPVQGNDPMSTVADGCPGLQRSADCRSATPRPRQPRERN